MTCKIDHDGSDCIPRFLCRTCNPVKPAADLHQPRATAEPGSTDDATAKRYRSKKRRRLRAEVRDLNEALELLRTRGAPKTEIDRAEARWQSAYKELATLEDDHE